MAQGVSLNVLPWLLLVGTVLTVVLMNRGRFTPGAETHPVGSGRSTAGPLPDGDRGMITQQSAYPDCPTAFQRPTARGYLYWQEEKGRNFPVSFWQLEERMRSLDAYLQLSVKTGQTKDAVQDWKALRPDGIAMRHLEEVKHFKIWQHISTEYGHCFSTLCEVGVNAGHSAVVWLEAQPNARVVLWDLFVPGSRQAAAKEYLEQTYTERVTFFVGSSHETLKGPLTAGGHPLKCDVIAVDGDKGYAGRIKDIRAFKQYAVPGAIILLDDSDARAVMGGESFFKPTGVDKAYKDLINDGTLRGVKALHDAYPKISHHMGQTTLIAAYA